MLPGRKVECARELFCVSRCNSFHLEHAKKHAEKELTRGVSDKRATLEPHFPPPATRVHLRSAAVIKGLSSAMACATSVLQTRREAGAAVAAAGAGSAAGASSTPAAGVDSWAVAAAAAELTEGGERAGAG